MGLNWERDRNARLWRSSERESQQAEAGLGRLSPTKTRGASAKQIEFLQDLLEKAGRRPYTPQELATLTVESASRLIKSLK